MGANTEALRGTRQVQLPAWIVIGTALAVMAALAVVTLSDRDATTPARAPGVTVVASTAGSPDDVAEIAELKATRALGTAFRSADASTTKLGQGPANQGPARRFPSTTDEIAWLKATRAQAANPFGRHS